MEGLLQQQNSLGEKLIKLISNYKKDAQSRKTKNYLEKKKQELSELYSKYKANDTEIIQTETFDQNMPYFDERQQIQRASEKIMADINSQLETAIETPTTTPAVTPTSLRPLESNKYTLQQGTSAAAAQPSQSMDLNNQNEGMKTIPKISEIYNPTATNNNDDQKQRLLKRQMIKINHLESLVNQAHSLQKQQLTKEFLFQKIKQLNADMVKIDELHEEILLDTTEEDLQNQSYFTNNRYYEIIHQVEVCTAKLHQIADNTLNNNKQQINMDFQLQKIEIPKFSGEYQQWISFFELFTRLVHQNNSLTNTHKIMYLKTHLEGAAAKVILHLQPVGDNYESAMEILIARYQNKRLLVNTHINTIFGLHQISSESASAIRILHDTVRENLHAVKNLGIDISTWGAWLVPYLTKKLDNETLKAYEISLKNPKEIQTTDDFLGFLEQRSQALGNLRAPKMAPQLEKTRFNYFKQHTYSATISKKQICILCSSNHNLECCQKFKRMTHIERMQLVNLHELCRLCLAAGHDLRQCNNQKRCKECNGQHNSFLHSKQPTIAISKGIQSNNAIKDHTTTLLATAIVKTTRYDGREELLRLLIDSGSQTSFITTEAKQRLNLTGRRISAEVHGVGGQIAGKVNSIITINLQPRYPSEYSIDIDALVLNKISKNLPERPFSSKKWKHLNELLLADPNYNIPAPIDILLGVDYYGQIMKSQLVKGKTHEPAAQLTEFGWVILGRISTPNEPSVIKVNSNVTSTEIDEHLKKFWEIEELHPPRMPTKSETECEENFRKTHKRLHNGRYEVRIPFQKNPEAHLGESKRMATARFLQVERRLSREPALKEKYMNFMREYQQLGHMTLIKKVDKSAVSYYLPHHAVMKESSTTTKLRVVFDGSAKTTTGISLNDIMLNGPTLQQDLISILMRWRKHEFVFKADIEKMFRQILINEADQNYQRLLWRESPKEEIKTFNLKTVTYGTTAATYLATKVLCQLALDDRTRYPVASAITLKDFYVDDLLSGADSLVDALEAQSQLIQLLKSGGFNLRQWASNNKQLTEHLPANSCEGGLCPIQIDDTIKTLGINWNPTSDAFEFKITSSEKREPTKRIILAEIAKLFDPLGWFAPIIIQAKLLMQNLWIAGIEWDEPLSAELEQQWFKFKNGLNKIEEIKIARWVEHKQQAKNELHGFSDASEKAFAAVVYYKTTNRQGFPVVSLIAAKSKVAHIKNRISLPRLELCGAVLLSRLLKTVQEAMNLEHVSVYAWTDSMITLGWIKGNPNKYKTFVGNRISEIQSLMQPSQWHYVKTDCNPADIASRGMNAQQLQNNQLWWKGPNWLRTSSYPLAIRPTQEVSNEELKINCLITNTPTVPELIEFERFSSALKIKRTIAYCYKFIAILKNRIHSSGIEIPNYITSDELSKAHNTIIRTIQESEFTVEIKSIKTRKITRYNNKLLSLNPFIDNEGLLRVGGRLQKSHLNYNQKHPLILPSHHIFSKLVTQEAHKLTLHGGVQATLAQLRAKYWILKGKSLARTTIHSCVKCFRFRRTNSEQLMGMLPKERITPSAPFTNTGIDYAGPFSVRVSKGRGNKSYKGYIALFVCFSTKAIHLELVSDLTTASFLAAFKRFVSRRGTPLNIYSDNGTNFVGARNEMEKEMQLAIKQTNNVAAQQTANSGTKWHFIPPASPHFGGLWEAGVKSTKQHLKKVIGETTLTYEEFTTVLTQIEACLNSRPILPMSSDPDDYEALTPGHFLIGRPLIASPESDKTNISTPLRWALVSKMTQRLWKIWSMEYITRLQQRPKWAIQKENYEIGQLVLIKEDNLPPTKWSLGRITGTHSGSDGLTRVVSLRGPKNIEFKRPITKISPLPTEDNQSLLKQSNKDESTRNEKLANKPTRTKALYQKTALSTMIYMPLIILAAIFNICTASMPSFNITKFKSEPGIYFESIGDLRFSNNNWNIIVYYNLTSYYEVLESYRRCTTKLDKLCSFNDNFTNSSLTRKTRSDICSMIEPAFRQSLLEMEHNDELLHHKNVNFGRSKRGALNIVGNIASELFGVLDDRDAAHYEQEIEKLKLNNNHFLALMKNHTSIIDATVNVFKKRQEDIDDHWQIFKEQLSEALTKNDEINKILAVSIHTLLRMISFKATQDTLIDAVLDTHNRVTTIKLLTAQQLKNEVDLIIRNLPTEIMPPNIEDTDDILALYKTMTTKTKLKGNYLIFELKIPLVYKEIYQIYEPIPLPTTNNPSVFIRPQIELLGPYF